MITTGTLDDPDDEGRFRLDDDIHVVDQHGTILHTPPSHAEIYRLINEVCKFVNTEIEPFLHPVVKGIILHFLIGYIHPFNDGNGRCARTLFYWFLLREDYWLFEFMPISRAIRDSRGQYKRAYLYAESDDFKVGKLVNNTTSSYISEFIDTISGEILADFEDFGEFCHEVAHKQIDGIQRFRHH